MEINLQSNSPYKQNYILLYQYESAQCSLLRGCPVSSVAAVAVWAETQNPSCYKPSINLGVFTCLDEKILRGNLTKSITSHKDRQTM